MANSFSSIAIDCSEPAGAAQFWGEVLGRRLAEESTSEQVVLLTDDVATTGPLLVFNKVPGAEVVKNRLDLDLMGETFDAETKRLSTLGAEGSAVSKATATAGRRSPTSKATSSTSSSDDTAAGARPSHIIIPELAERVRAAASYASNNPITHHDKGALNHDDHTRHYSAHPVPRRRRYALRLPTLWDSGWHPAGLHPARHG
jgi:catechol 2,3-dioxygenase-like lactoylglutathione lyase family enzyme